MTAKLQSNRVLFFSTERYTFIPVRSQSGYIANVQFFMILFHNYQLPAVQKPTMLSIQPPSSPPSKDQCTPNLLPCRIHHNGPANASQRYWNPTVGAGTPYYIYTRDDQERISSFAHEGFILSHGTKKKKK